MSSMKNYFLWMVLAVFCLSGCDKNDEDGTIAVTGLSIAENMTLQIGETKQIEVTYLPNNATLPVELSWSSSKEAVAGVAQDGTVQALSAGESTVTVCLKSNTSVRATCVVTVIEAGGTDPNEELSFEDNRFAALVLQFDKNNDGVLQRWEAELITEINVNGQEIKSLRGIEYFTNLEVLACSINLLDSLDVSGNTKLKELYCHSNRIAELDVTMLPDLTHLNCRSNRLSALDVTHNPKLISLQCGMNGGRSYDDLGITRIDVTQNPELEELDVYFLNLSALDVTHNPKLRVLDMGYCCHTYWSLTPIETIDLSQNPELEVLNCVSSNVEGYGLDALDVTHNPKLKQLTTYGNPKIKELDLSNNKELTLLNCGHNALSALDVTACTQLETLSCPYNTIAVLDLTRCTELVHLNCADNQIGMLDFSQTKLGYLEAQNNRIEEINMGDKTFDTPSAENSGYDHAGEPYLYMKLNNNRLTSIDLSRQTYLYWLEICDNELTSLDVNNCKMLGGLLCSGNQLTELSLAGLSRIWELNCSDNQLTGVLDLAHLSLTRMAAQNNQLATIRVPADFNPDATYFMGGVGTLPCYTKDAATQYEFAAE